MADHETERERMVRSQIQARGVRDPRVLDALRAVPRHEFLPASARPHAHEDHPQPIGEGQTISQPYMVGVMTELLALTGTERVLEIGTGSGYQTAVLARLAALVFTVERIPALAERAKAALDRLEVTNVRYRTDDGSRGWPEEAPFDRILVTAAAPYAPESLVRQLGEPGILVLPTGHEKIQDLVSVHREGGQCVRKIHFKCTFVPLIGEEGFQP